MDAREATSRLLEELHARAKSWWIAERDVEGFRVVLELLTLATALQVALIEAEAEVVALRTELAERMADTPRIVQ